MSARHATGGNAPINGWTVNVLKEHIEAMMAEHDKRYEEKFAAKTEMARQVEDASTRALCLAEKSSHEFRKMAEQRLSESITRSEYSVQHEILQQQLVDHINTEADRITLQEKMQDEKMKELKEGMTNINKWLVGLLGGVVIALILTVVDILVRSFSQ